MTDPASLFVPDGERFVPTALAAGPWHPEALHGGPPAALLASAIESFDGGDGMFVARATFEFMRPIPRRPLARTARWVRPGRKVQLIEASLFDGDREVARATGLRIRKLHVGLPADLPTDPVERVPGPAQGEGLGPGEWWLPGFHTQGVEHRFVRGGFEELGPGTDWIRVLYPLLPDEPLSPLARVCACADFGNGVSGVLGGTHTYVNPDLTVYLHRYPHGEWVCLDSVTRLGELGVGTAESLLRDEQGPIGRAVQSLLVEPR